MTNNHRHPTAGELAELLEPALARLAELIAQRVSELEEQRRPAGGSERSPWLNVATAAAYLDWPKQRLYKLTARGEIPHYKQDGRLLFRRDELDRWLTSYADGPRP